MEEYKTQYLKIEKGIMAEIRHLKVDLNQIDESINLPDIVNGLLKLGLANFSIGDIDSRDDLINLEVSRDIEE